MKPAIKFRIVALTCIAIFFWFVLCDDQTNKESVFQLYKDAVAADYVNQSFNYRNLLDIKCSLRNVDDTHKETLLLAIKTAEKTLNDAKSASFLEDSTKDHIVKALEYQPLECRVGK